MPEASQTILIVNDNPDHLLIMRVLLEKADYRVLTARDGREGIDLALTQQPGLVISDVNMPICDGIELCRRIRAEASTSMMPIMLVSAERMGSLNAVEGLRAGADDYLEAPYDPIRLIAKVARLLERKHGEEAVRASEVRYRLLFENNPIPMWVYDLESLSFLDVNEAAVQQYGYSRAEFLRMTIKEIRPPEELPALLHDLETRRPGVNMSGVWRHRKRDGTLFDAEITSHGLIFEGRRAVIALSNDVTERRRAEAAIRFQAHLLDTVEQAVIASDLDGRIIYWNRFAEKLYGWSAAQAVGRNLIDVTPAEVSREKAAEIWAKLKAGQSWSGEYLVKRKDGAEFPALITNSPIYDDDGTLIGVVGLSVDITERKREEERLKQSERQLSEAQQLARIGNWVWDIPTNTVTWSDELYRIFGLEPQEFGATYEAFLERLHPDDREQVVRTIDKSLADAKPFANYQRVILPDGSVCILHTRGAVTTGADGRPVRMFGTAQDVTERMRAEEQLKKSNEQLRALSVRLQTAREEQSIRIAREIHDELGSALTGLKMDMSWLARRLSGQSPDGVHQKFQSALQLIDETVSKVRNISTQLRPSVLDDLGLAAAIEWQAREFQKRTEIECRIVSLQEDITLSAEKSTAVFRIFQEILTNVTRHAQASRVEVCMEEHGGDLILKVSDNGVGIKENEIGEAKSLGLLGMRERAMVFGGEVKVVGADGRGTTVTVRIPLA